MTFVLRFEGQDEVIGDLEEEYLNGRKSKCKGLKLENIGKFEGEKGQRTCGGD